MESTREQVLHLLQARGPATIAVLTDELGVGQASVRRHLDHLRVDGLVDVRMERHGVGRPAFVFYPTEQADEQSPAGYPRLLSRLHQELRALPEGDARGRDGAEVMRTLFEGVAGQVAREHKEEVAAHSLEGRVAETSRALQGEGIVDAWAKAGDGYHLTNSACPYRQAALAGHGTCELDRRTIELLIGSPVQQVSRIADGKPACEYIVAAAAERSPEQSG